MFGEFVCPKYLYFCFLIKFRCVPAGVIPSSSCSYMYWFVHDTRNVMFLYSICFQMHPCVLLCFCSEHSVLIRLESKLCKGLLFYSHTICLHCNLANRLYLPPCRNLSYGNSRLKRKRQTPLGLLIGPYTRPYMWLKFVAYRSTVCDNGSTM